MQAIILAAGMGRRLGELTNDNTKCMLEVNGVRLIHRALDALHEVGIKRVVLVVGYKAENVRELIGARSSMSRMRYTTRPTTFIRYSLLASTSLRTIRYSWSRTLSLRVTFLRGLSSIHTQISPL